MQPPRTITFSLVEALALLQLNEFKNEVMAVVFGSLLIVTGWLLFC